MLFARTFRPTAMAAVTLASLTYASTIYAADPVPANSSPEARVARVQQSPDTASVIAKADPQMKAMLDALASLNPKPVETLAPDEARKNPGPADAVKKVMTEKGLKPEEVGKIEMKKVESPEGDIPVRVYSPKGAGPFPVLVYFHGGGWVIGSLDAYDGSCRALTNMAGCIVVSVDYRQAPEHRFPAAHNDCYYALQWVLSHTEQLGGDPQHVAVGGESAGGNMAAAVCLMARDKKAKLPVHQLLIYPVSGTSQDTESYKENANAKPLNAAMMSWFFDKYLSSPADAASPYLSILKAPNLSGLPPATVITVQIDPLRSEGQAYAAKLKAAGVQVQMKNYEGLTHEAFGMGAVIDKAKEAEQFAAEQLKTAFTMK